MPQAAQQDLGGSLWGGSCSLRVFPARVVSRSSLTGSGREAVQPAGKADWLAS